MQKHPREIEKMLDRVHRQTRPWAGVGVFMMQIGSIKEASNASADE